MEAKANFQSGSKILKLKEYFAKKTLQTDTQSKKSTIDLMKDLDDGHASSMKNAKVKRLKVRLFDDQAARNE